MAFFFVTDSPATINGTPTGDVFVVTADAISDTTLVDGGGTDTFLLLDTNNRDVTTFFVQDGSLVYRAFQGSTVSFALTTSGAPTIELMVFKDLSDPPEVPGVERLFVTASSQITQADFLFAMTAGNDVVTLGGSNSTGNQSWVFAHDGNDEITARNGRSYWLVGGEGDDTLRGANRADEITGDNGSDRLFDGKGRDLLEGGDGGDRIFGGAGNDVLVGEDGDDVLFGGGDADRFEFFHDGSNDVIADISVRDTVALIGFDGSLTLIENIGSDLRIEFFGTLITVRNGAGLDLDILFV